MISVDTGVFAVGAMCYSVEYVRQDVASVWIVRDLTRDGCMVMGSTRDQALITLGQAQRDYDDAFGGAA